MQYNMHCIITNDEHEHHKSFHHIMNSNASRIRAPVGSQARGWYTPVNAELWGAREAVAGKPWGAEGGLAGRAAEGGGWGTVG